MYVSICLVYKTYATGVLALNFTKEKLVFMCDDGKVVIANFTAKTRNERYEEEIIILSEHYRFNVCVK